MKHLRGTCDSNVCRGSHARTQAEVGIVNAELDIVGHDIVGDDRAIRHTLHRRVVTSCRPGIDRECCRLTCRDAPDVGLGNRDDEIHFPQVLGDHEKHRCSERRRHRLANFHRARKHNAIDRRTDDALGKIAFDRAQACLSFIDRRLGALEFGLRAIDRSLRGVHLCLRWCFAFAELQEVLEACE